MRVVDWQVSASVTMLSGCAQARAGESEAAEQALKAQAYAREMRSGYKRHTAACETLKAQQEQRIEELERRYPSTRAVC